MLELHCHTTFSDGTLTPTELVNAAIAAGVRALAITDHDTMAGWDEARQAATGQDLEIVPGLELSTVHNGKSLHVLGFYPDRAQLEDPLQDRLSGRKRRAAAMRDKLAALGYPVELPELGPGMAPGRPHLAAAMVRAGYVPDSQTAFDKFLGDGKPAYVEYERFEAVEGIRLLRSCGSVPVWAHPYLFRGGTVETVLPDLVAAGLMGLEVYHPYHSPYQVDKLEQLCEAFGLIKTGGSDYHGPKPEAEKPAYAGSNTHGTLNSLQVPIELLGSLKGLANRVKQEAETEKF
ncbi:PHP domain-containing protein [Alkalinema sp. FACHB-956]|uniref:PHP domain-containing protein n=1 Tax=Alkalinema sp. FACHB-956 TaxID=2692768 RepID=UPI0016874417|nr:PHP domain-containing protein [Alkalinema sp. FACHB-956]MBD2327597.1 PHP domain-containing protein [Alkalinema sp. FACHB-956]